MAWARIDDKFFTHPKVREVGAEATMLYLVSLVYCNEHLTEGIIKDSAMPMIAMLAFQDVAKAKQNASKLLEANLWEREENAYKIHDYHEYNPTKEEVASTKRSRADAGKKGGLAKSAANSADNQPYIEDKPSKTQAKPKQIASGLLQNVSSKSLAISPPLPSPILNTTTTGGGGENSARISEVFTAYENNMGMITPITADQIKETISEFTNEWIMAAIGEAMKNNVRKWSYVEAVLDRWKVDGFQSKSARGQPGNTSAGKRKRTTSDVVAEAMAEWEAEQKSKEQAE